MLHVVVLIVCYAVVWVFGPWLWRLADHGAPPEPPRAVETAPHAVRFRPPLPDTPSPEATTSDQSREDVGSMSYLDAEEVDPSRGGGRSVEGL